VAVGCGVLVGVLVMVGLGVAVGAGGGVGLAVAVGKTAVGRSVGRAAAWDGGAAQPLRSKRRTAVASPMLPNKVRMGRCVVGVMGKI